MGRSNICICVYVCFYFYVCVCMYIPAKGKKWVTQHRRVGRRKGGKGGLGLLPWLLFDSIRRWSGACSLLMCVCVCVRESERE